MKYIELLAVMVHIAAPTQLLPLTLQGSCIAEASCSEISHIHLARSKDCITYQHPFSCDKSKKQVLQASLNATKHHEGNAGSDCESSNSLRDQRGTCSSSCFYVKKRIKNGTQCFSRWNRCFRFTYNWLWPPRIECSSPHQ